MTTKDIAVVTGGASGIGRATTETLAARNIEVIAIDLNAELLAELENRDRIHPHQGDVSSNDTWAEVVARAQSDLGSAPNLFVANAAFTWGPQPHKGSIFLADFNSGLWAVRLKDPDDDAGGN